MHHRNARSVNQQSSTINQPSFRNLGAGCPVRVVPLFGHLSPKTEHLPQDKRKRLFLGGIGCKHANILNVRGKFVFQCSSPNIEDLTTKLEKCALKDRKQFGFNSQ